MRTAIRRTRWAVAFGLGILTLVSVVPARALDVTQVLGRVRSATVPGKDMRATFDFEMMNAKGESVHWAGSYYHRSVPDERVRLVIDSPIDLRGTEVAMTPDHDGVTRQRLYVPSLRRVRDLLRPESPGCDAVLHG